MPDEQPSHPAPPTAGHAPAISPMPVPEDAAEILFVGGSFDPPTLAHAHIASAARDAALGESVESRPPWLVFVPAARSPFKPDPPAADTHRVAMLGLVAGGLARASVWTDELDRAAARAPSYWIETLRRARTIRPHARLWFLIGADQATEFHRWREAPEIVRLASPLVVL
ncbi:MAG: nicotinate-nicotinamide nucleotide adenylyltransferase, partial [Phycisphaerales bacterium JB041]